MITERMLEIFKMAVDINSQDGDWIISIDYVGAIAPTIIRAHNTKTGEYTIYVCAPHGDWHDQLDLYSYDGRIRDEDLTLTLDKLHNIMEETSNVYS
jgi:hypothetical protein